MTHCITVEDVFFTFAVLLAASLIGFLIYTVGWDNGRKWERDR